MNHQMMMSYPDFVKSELIHSQNEELLRLPKTNKGRMVEDLLQRMGLEVMNPEDITLDTYLEMIEDSAVRSSLQVIINSVLSPGWEILGGNKEHREFLIEMYKAAEIETAMERSLSAFWVGFSVEEKVFDQDRDGLWFVDQYKILPPETITFEVKDTGEIKKVIQDGILLGSTKRITFTGPKVNIFTYDNGLSQNFGNPYGVSALKGAYKDWFMKDWILRWWQRWLELMAGGLIVANAGFLDPVVLHQQVQLSKSTSVITIREGQKIEFIQPKGDGQAFMGAAEYHDKRMREALLVPTLLVSQDDMRGSAATAGVQREVFESTRLERLQQQLMGIRQKDIQQIYDINWGPHPEEGYPQFQFKISSMEALRNRSRIVLDLVRAGILGVNHLEWIWQFLNIPTIEEGRGDLLITPANPVQPRSGGTNGAPAQQPGAQQATQTIMNAADPMGMILEHLENIVQAIGAAA
jgi:hypothetical protein